VQMLAKEVEKRCANIHVPLHFASIDNPAHGTLRLTSKRTKRTENRVAPVERLNVGARSLKMWAEIFGGIVRP
jgi:hypothetical protein